MGSMAIETRIFRLLSKRNGWTDTELADRLQVSRSTIQRGLRRLRIAGVLKSQTVRSKLGSCWINRRSLKIKE